MNTSGKDTSVEISIIIPVFNEEENILPLTNEITETVQQIRRTCEIVFVDDASTDRTWEKIREAQRKNEHVRGLRHSQNAGQSAAVWTGIQATDSPIIATLDGDRQNDPADLPKLIRALDDCDFVCGVRTQRNDSAIRRFSTKAARWARRKALKVDFADTGCALRVFRREALRGIFPFNGLHRFLPVLVHANGAKTREVPIGHRARTCGVSKYGISNRLWRGIYDLLAVAWYQKRRIGHVDYIELTPEPRESQPHRLTAADFDVRRRAPEFRPVEHE